MTLWPAMLPVDDEEMGREQHPLGSAWTRKIHLRALPSFPVIR